MTIHYNSTGSESGGGTGGGSDTPEPTPQEQYRINSIVIQSESGDALSEIPEGTFLATVSITNVSSASNAMVCLTAYAASGQYQGLIYVRITDCPMGATLELTVPVDNREGKIDQIRAFTLSSFTDMRPVSSPVSFPAA